MRPFRRKAADDIDAGSIDEKANAAKKGLMKAQ